jgi:MFS family permease
MSNSSTRGSLAVIFLTVFIDLLGFGIVLPLLPIYADQFSTDESGWQLGLLMASFSIMQFLVAPIWGRISDYIGRRPVILIGLAGSVIFYTLFGVATVWKSMPLLFVARIGAGAAGATVSTAQAYIADTTSLESRSRGMALIGMAFGLGFTFGPILGFLAVPDRSAAPGPWPGYVAAMISAFAFLLAVVLLPESKSTDSESGARKIVDWKGIRRATSIPSMGMLLTVLFICVFSLAKFETTLSLLIKGERSAVQAPFSFSWGQVCLTYAFIGLTLAVVQGGLVRRLAGRFSEGGLATSGAVLEILGFGLLLAAIATASTAVLFVALTVIVGGVSFMHPNINSLISRRSDPASQGMILGVGQSVNAIARILGSAVGIPLLRIHLAVPYVAVAALMVVALLLIIVASRSGQDFTLPPEESNLHHSVL